MMKQDAAAEHPGLILKEKFLDPLGISPSELAESIGVSVRRVSELVKGRRRLTPDMAHRLGLYFNVPALWFLEMQARYDAQAPDLGGMNVTLWNRKDDVLITPTGALDLGKPKRAQVEPLMVKVPQDLVDRLAAQAKLGRRTLNRVPKIIELPDGTPVLTGE